jgi:soluble lytic murein transglycosylase
VLLLSARHFRHVRARNGLARAVRIPAVLGVRVSALLIFALSASSAWSEGLSVYQQRAEYKAALDYLTQGNTRAFRKAESQLQDYVLAPYLAYRYLQSRLSSASADDISEFESRYGYLPVADIVYSRWLRRLGRSRDWPLLLEHYRPSSDATLNCYRLRALYATGQREAAFAEAGDLWMVAKSQPKVCDPLFDAWMSAGNLTETMVWKRLQLALDANARTLARYLQRFFKSDVRVPAQAYYNVHVSPTNITRVSRYSSDDAYWRAVIRHGLLRLANRDPEKASGAWRQYQHSHEFSDESRQDIEAALAVGHARQGRFPEDPASVPDSDRIGGESRQERRWQYWLARSLAGSVLSSERADLTYAALADQRNYYGFLAAEQIGRPASMNNEPLQLSPVRINQLRRQPAVARAIELFAVGDLINARREWRELLPALSDEDRAAAAALAESIGWIDQSIRIASVDSLRNTLALRFPLAYPDSFQQVSHATNVSRAFLQAIARQESAFNPKARSSANARGLMQLMHPTASAVARRVGLTAPTVSELYDPSLNVELAGHHLAELLDRYDQQRPLAAAAYNAGESRVRRWTRDRSGMAMDVWIETIPFRETRNYVKNVLAFDQVYSELMGQPVPMLKVHEAAVP